jgi:hypothetical protein
LGGYGSGRQYGQPTAEACLRVDLSWMLRERLAVPDSNIKGTVRWTNRGRPSGSISYEANMANPENAWLILTYTRGTDDDKEDVTQEIRLTSTKPNYGGRRWWMICPYRGVRAGTLYLPNGGDRFASRKAWRVGYNSQRITERDRHFEALFKLQDRLSGPQGWDAGLARRPKGMWHRTYERMWSEYHRLDKQCAYEMAGVLQRLKSRW